MRVADLSAGAGGMLLGFRLAGHQPVFFCENDPFAMEVVRANFPILPGVRQISGLEPSSLPHPEVVCFAHPAPLGHIVRILGTVKPRAIVVEWTTPDLPELQALGYEMYWELMDAREFGLPQARKRHYLVAFRSDVHARLPFLAFPFPSGDRTKRTLADVLQKEAQPELSLPQSSIDSMTRHNEKVKGSGFRFKYRVFGPESQTPAFPARYHKDGYDLIVNAGAGPRKLSVLECQRLMGFPDEYSIPLSRTQAYRLLGGATCPPVAAAIATELGGWLSPV